MKSKSLIYIIMLLSGIVVGTFIGELARGVRYLEWLSYGIKFGTNGPVSLNLGVLALDFGLSINLTISSIIFVLIALIIARKVL
ncbi:MAG: DUF4321 domain-containing protein [Clostridia bacterium]|nr:DUF4321 domain-containing protein [Clostridia bacterium]